MFAGLYDQLRDVVNGQLSLSRRDECQPQALQKGAWWHVFIRHVFYGPYEAGAVNDGSASGRETNRHATIIATDNLDTAVA